MTAFTLIARPHRDLEREELTEALFAADLWQVSRGEGPAEYRDRELFFKKTYATKGLSRILKLAEERLRGERGEGVVQLQTPFGGGKTHALIALFHKACEWGKRVAVFDGTAESIDSDGGASVRPWERIEEQLLGESSITKGAASPGKDRLLQVLSKAGPSLILMDEISLYATKAAAVEVGSSSFAEQFLAFMQELTSAVNISGDSLLVFTLPSSDLEHYGHQGVRLAQQLQKIAGRMEAIYTPVEDDEIDSVIRARLFESIDEREVRKLVDNFCHYLEREGLPSSEELICSRERFLRSYPFKPEVIEVLYQKWGSYPTFQRTRGVLRLLSLVIRALWEKQMPFIGLGHFDLGDSRIREELIKHIGNEWEGIIARDIADDDSGAKAVDLEMGSSYRSYQLGTSVATAIFMNSFSGRGERGCTLTELKIATALPDFSSSVIDSAVARLKERLFFLSDRGLYFTNQPNLNKLLLDREENIPESKLREKEEELVERAISKGSPFKLVIFPNESRDIPDDESFKLVILREREPTGEFLENFGYKPRIFRNNIFFLCPYEGERGSFYQFLRKLLALEEIVSESAARKIILTNEQKSEVKRKLENARGRIYESLLRYYCRLYIPERDGYKQLELSLPNYGDKYLDREVFFFLKSKDELLDRIAPQAIRELVLTRRRFVRIRDLWDSMLKTPGETRIIKSKILLEGIKNGVEAGIFGLGTVEGEEVSCRYFRDQLELFQISMDDYLLSPELCESSAEDSETREAGKGDSSGDRSRLSASVGGAGYGGRSPKHAESAGVESGGRARGKVYTQLRLDLRLQPWNLTDISDVLSFIQKKFTDCELELTIRAKGGELTNREYEDVVLETLHQLEVEIKGEEKE